MLHAAGEFAIPTERYGLVSSIVRYNAFVKGGPQNFNRVFWAVLPVWVVLAIEGVGGWRFGKDMYSSRYAIDLHGFYWPLIYLVCGGVIFGPILVLIGFLGSRSGRPKSDKRFYRGALLFLVVSLLISMFSCVWTCGGHPTWTSGYK